MYLFWSHKPFECSRAWPFFNHVNLCNDLLGCVFAVDLYLNLANKTFAHPIQNKEGRSRTAPCSSRRHVGYPWIKESWPGNAVRASQHKERGQHVLSGGYFRIHSTVNDKQPIQKRIATDAIWQVLSNGMLHGRCNICWPSFQDIPAKLSC